MSPGCGRDAYEVLGLHRSTSQEEIRKAYKGLVLKYHPDKAGKSEVAQARAKQRFQEIQAAYEAIAPSKRETYDSVPSRQTRSELHAACASGNYGLVQDLLQQQADVNEADGTGRTALMLAAATSSTLLCRLLLDAKASLDARNCAGHSCLMFAVGSSVKRVCPTLEVEGHMTKQLDMVRFLLDEGSPVDACTGYGLTSLMLASAAGRVDLVDLLLSRGAEVLAATDVGLTSLVMAADKGHSTTVKHLLCAHADANRRYGTGKTALHGAAMLAHLEVVGDLLEHGAEVNACCDRGYSPLLHAVDSNVKDGLACPIQGESAEKSLTRSTVQALLDAVADPNHAGPGQRTALHVVCASGEAKLVKVLLLARANAQAKDAKQNTPLMLAAESGHDKVVKVLENSTKAADKSRCMAAFQEGACSTLASLLPARLLSLKSSSVQQSG
mmetsp:Transcript_26974/g.62254  ORF Transcript_26974/g.62254 Transcript_26974/m.62254 type:complete len:442 (+) Transcript_26974:41-1366(+)